NLKVRTQILVSRSCLALWHKTPPSLVELDKNLQLTTYISLKACIPLRVGNESFHPVKSCCVFLYSGFVVLTLLQVLSLERVTGPLSQVLRLIRLLDADLEDHRLWAGHDLLYVYFAIF